MLDNTQSINDGTAYFTITISNPDDSAPLNNISVIDAPVADCNKSVAQINTMMTAAIGNVKPNSSTSKNNILEPGESFSYNCSSKTLSAPFPNNETTATVNASTADAFKAPVTKVSAVTGAEYFASSGINVAIIHDTKVAGETTDTTTQSINDGKAYFTVTVKNT